MALKPFVFRWRRMLRLSEGFESDRRNALAAALAGLARAEDARDWTIGELDKQRAKRFELLSMGTDITIIRNNYQREVALTLRIEAQGDVIAEHEKAVEKRREELTERMRERKTYGKLRERALEQHTIETKREENRITDDVASIAFGRAQADENGKD
jgi:flagellar FliJ protein